MMIILILIPIRAFIAVVNHDDDDDDREIA